MLTAVPDRPRHLLWIPVGAAVAFATSFVFADLLSLPVFAYHAVYFVIAATFLSLYVRRTRVSLRVLLKRRLSLAVILGLLGGLVLARRVFSDAASVGAPGFERFLDLLWRGLLYGVVDGALLSSFPWLVAWHALGGEAASLAKRVTIGVVALVAALAMTSAYHAGYPDFRGAKLVQANIGNGIASLPTVLAAHPLATPIAHAILHIAAVSHNPQSDLFLPPHRGQRGAE